MKKLLIASFLGLFLTCSFFVSAGEELNIINAEVEKAATQIDQEYGVLLTGQERNTLKISLVASKITKELPNGSVSQKKDRAIKIYELTDPIDQRQLLIEIKVAGGGGGVHPIYHP